MKLKPLQFGVVSQQFFKEHLKDFCDNSTVQGLRYLTEPNRNRVDR